MAYKIEKIWQTNAGFKAVVIRLMGPYIHHRCGYVGLPKDHPLHGVKYSDHHECLMSLWEGVKEGPIGKRGTIPLFCRQDKSNPAMDVVFDVHGSITFSDGDGKYPIEGPEWWLGFDCGHACDQEDPKTLEYCVSECESLAKQLKEVT